MDNTTKSQLTLLIDEYAEASKRLGHAAELAYTEQLGQLGEDDYLRAKDAKLEAQNRLLDFLAKL